MTWPSLTAATIKKYFSNAFPAMDKGHMKRQRQGIWSTNGKVLEALKSMKTAQVINPPMVIEKENHLFCYPAAINHEDGIICVDFTG